jgi:hypothetical protein
LDSGRPGSIKHGPIESIRCRSHVLRISRLMCHAAVGGQNGQRYRGAMAPNFTLLDVSRSEIASLLAAMLQARAAVEQRSWSHPQEPAGEEWWADVLTDPRVRRRSQPGLQGRGLQVRPVFYRLRDEPHTRHPAGGRRRSPAAPLQHYLGHKNIQHTVRYTEMAPDPLFAAKSAIVRWFAWTRPQSNSSPRRACRSR